MSDLWGVIFDVGTLVIAAAGVWFAKQQLTRSAEALEASARANELGAKALEASSKSNELGAKALESSFKSNELARLMALLQLETMMGEARLRIVEAFRELEKSRQSGSSVEGSGSGQFGRAVVEGYLNLLDRFCSCVRQGIIPEDTYRRDYRDLIKEAISVHSAFFGSATNFRHIQHVHSAWADDKTAIDMPWDSSYAIVTATQVKALGPGVTGTGT